MTSSLRDADFRILNVVDDVTRECLAAIPDTRRVARELMTLIERRGKPRLDCFREWHGVRLERDAVVGSRPPDRMAFLRAGKANAEQLQREFQRPYAGRTAE
jgi:hypothetical protein